MPRQVAITGLGAVSSLGVGFPALWNGLLAGTSALGPITRFDASGFHCRLAGEVKDFSAKDHVPKHYRKAVKIMARDIELAVAAAKEAAEDAGLITRANLPEGGTGETTFLSERFGCHIGAALIAADTQELTMAMATAVRAGTGGDPAMGNFSLKAWGTEDGGEEGMNNLTPLWLLKYLPNMLASHVTIIHGAEGPSNTITCNEASGLLSISESLRVIQRGAADICFSGGAESNVNFMRLIRLELAGRLALTGDVVDGSTIVRPYDEDSRGSLSGEAAGIIMVEALQTAQSRGGRIYALISGIGAAHSPPPSIPPFKTPLRTKDEGLQFAVEAALADAGVNPADIDAIVPRATGTPDLDIPEAVALEQVFGSRLSQVPIITIAPNIRDALSGQGGLAAAIGARAIHSQMLPARIHGGNPRNGIMAVQCQARQANLRHILVCTGSTGGQNAAIILSRSE